MAKQYLDENGVKQLWGKCKDKFASKANLDSYVPKSGAYMTGDLFNTNYGFYANTIGGNFRVYTNEYWQEKGLNFRAYNPIGANGGVVQNEYTLEASGRHNMSGANAFFGVRTNQIILERSYDAGATWESYEDISIYYFLNVFVGNRYGSKIIPKEKCTTNAMFRITIASQAYNIPSGTKEVDKLKHMVESKAYTSTNRYMALDAFYTYQSTEQVRLQLTVQHAPSNNTEGSEPTFVTDAVVNKLQGWSGGGSFHLKNSILFGNASARFVRLIFRVQAPDGSFDNSKITPSNIGLYEICAFSGGKYISDPQWSECFYNSPLRIIGAASHDYDFVGNYIPHENKTQSIGTSAKYLKEIYVDNLHANSVNINEETGSFKLEGTNSAIKVKKQRCKYRFTNNQLIFDINLVLDNVSDSSVSVYTLAAGDISYLFSQTILENLRDFNGNPCVQDDKSWAYVAYGTSKDVIKLYDNDEGIFSGLPASRDFLIGLCRNWAGRGADMYLMCPPGYTFAGNSSLTLQARLVVSLYSD